MLELTKYEPFGWRVPFRRLADIHDEFDRLFEGFFSQSSVTSYGGISFTPMVDLVEEDDKYIFRAELPGMSRKDIKIETTENHLTISGEKKQEKEVKGEYSLSTERSYGAFCRTFHLDNSIKSDKVKAHYTDGILEVTLPKAEAAKAKHIDVKVE